MFPYDVYNLFDRNPLVFNSPYYAPQQRVRQRPRSNVFYRRPSYPEPEDVYTLNDILDLINRHQEANPDVYSQFRGDLTDADKPDETDAFDALTAAAEAQKKAKDAKVEAQAKARAHEAAEEAAQVAKEHEKAQEFADLIKKAITQPNKGKTFHKACASPVHDPLEVSQPQLNTNMPFSPQVDLYDLPNEYKLILALPGATKNSFEVDFHPSNQELFIKGNTTNKDKLVSKDKEVPEDKYLQYLKVSEINFGSFERSIKFPSVPKIDDEKIVAKYANGLLEISVPKKEAEKVKPKKRVTVEEVEDEELKFEEGLKKL